MSQNLSLRPDSRPSRPSAPNSRRSPSRRADARSVSCSAADRRVSADSVSRFVAGSSASASSYPLRPGPRFLQILGVIKVLAGLLLLVAISWEVIAGGEHFSRPYLAVQFVVCLLFLCDFFVRWGADGWSLRFFWRNLFYLLLSVPYLNIVSWSGVTLSRGAAMLLGLVPLLRAFLAMTIVVGWLVGNRVRRLLAAYIFTVVVFTYISALIFYDYELPVNPHLHGFGNALWWAWMNVTTVGAAIFPVTAIGKLFSVLLPSLGMMFFPIFTTYVLQEYAPSKTKDRDE